MRLRFRYAAVAVAVALAGTVAGVVIAASAHDSPTATTASARVSTCPYVASGGTALALVTVASAHGSCSAVNVDNLGQLGNVSSTAFTIDGPSSPYWPSEYPSVSGDDATDPVACRVGFAGGVTVTVYQGPLNAVEPMVCAALRGN